VRAIALAQVSEVAARVAIPVVGMGGVQRGADAKEMLRTGATIVAVGTESFRDPRAGARVAGELADLLSERSEITPETGIVETPQTGVT
jgi:dihydroorotate dehydrogenase (NAD+) catalytic subunit